MLAKKIVNDSKLHKGHFGNLNGEQALLLYDELPPPPLKIFCCLLNNCITKWRLGAGDNQELPLLEASS